MVIYFYSTRDEYGCFSNFSAHGFESDGLWWPTSEHYFQAHKFIDTPYFEAIRQVKSPKDAALMGRDRQRPLRPDWDEVKDKIMFRAVLRKFETHADIRAVLLSTGNEELIENTSTDYYWGCGTNKTGKNRLGQILIEVREKLRSLEIALFREA
jgi:N-glycosidase YbiA